MLKTICSLVFQAEAGILPFGVTGVQTCALPILSPLAAVGSIHASMVSPVVACRDGESRSEERRVGKECRCRWWPNSQKEKAVWLTSVPLLAPLKSLTFTSAGYNDADAGGVYGRL